CSGVRAGGFGGSCPCPRGIRTSSRSNPAERRYGRGRAMSGPPVGETDGGCGRTSIVSRTMARRQGRDGFGLLAAGGHFVIFDVKEVVVPAWRVPDVHGASTGKPDPPGCPPWNHNLWLRRRRRAIPRAPAVRRVPPERVWAAGPTAFTFATTTHRP